MIRSVNGEPKTNIPDFLPLHYQGQRREWPYIADMYTSMSKQCLFLLDDGDRDLWNAGFYFNTDETIAL
jgi:hypothetical protein